MNSTRFLQWSVAVEFFHNFLLELQLILCTGHGYPCKSIAYSWSIGFWRAASITPSRYIYRSISPFWMASVSASIMRLASIIPCCRHSWLNLSSSQIWIASSSDSRWSRSFRCLPTSAFIWWNNAKMCYKIKHLSEVFKLSYLLSEIQ